MKELFELYIAFFRIGALTFGGGYAMLPMFRKEAVERYKWVGDEELTDYYAVSQCIPGIIAINTSTFIGHKRRGWLGAVAATAGMITPAVIIILIIALFIQNFIEITYVQHALAGIRVAVCALILQATVNLWKSGVKDKIGIVIFACVVGASIFFSVSAIYIIVASAAAGVLVKMILKKKAGPQA